MSGTNRKADFPLQALSKVTHLVVFTRSSECCHNTDINDEKQWSGVESKRSCTACSDAALPSGLPNMAEVMEQLSSLKVGVMNYHNLLFEGLCCMSCLEQSALKEKLLMSESSSTGPFLMAKGLLRAVVLWFHVCGR